MDVNDASIFLNCIEPNIRDINRVKVYLNQTNKEYDELEDLINFIGSDSTKIVTYENQKLIYDYLNMVPMDIKNYEAIKYLASNESMKNFPQWSKAKQSLDSLLDFLLERKQNISERIDVLSYAYTEKYISKKYYDMFSKKDVFIRDPMIFMNFINRIELEDKEKIDIVKDAIKQNLKHYKDEDKIDSNELLVENRKYLTNKYLSMIYNVSKYIDLSKAYNELIEIKQNDYSKESLKLLKKIWIVNELYNCSNPLKMYSLRNELKELV